MAVRTSAMADLGQEGSPARQQLRAGIVVLLVLTLVTGVVYPLVVTLVAQLLMADQANGSLVVAEEHVVGSRLIGQSFAGPGYFWSRPSATSPFPYNAAASAGSNLGPMSDDLLRAVASRANAMRNSAPGAAPQVPADIVTASGSGLDPHVSVAAATYQVGRVARERALTEDAVRQLVEEHTEDRTLGLLGEPRVNVLAVNLALDRATATGGAR